MSSHRRLRLAVPVAVAGVIAAGSWGSTLTASASPDLPAISASKLVANVERSDVRHLSGTVRWTANLGLPSLSSVTSGSGQSGSSSSGFDPTSLLSGTHTFSFATDGQGRVRLSSAAPLQESDLVVNGNQAWVSESSTGRVHHYVADGLSSHRPDPTGMRSTADAATPAAVADRLLANIRAWSTAVTTTSPVDVAGHAAYQLLLTPDRSSPAAATSTVSDIVIAVDAATGMPVQVTVHAIGQSAPALQLGFTSLSYGVPPASDFAPLQGLSSSTTVVHPHGGHHAKPDPATRPANGSVTGVSLLGSRWSTIADVAPSQTAKALGANRSKIDAVTTVVSGSWGTGRLLSSSLINALVLPDGRVLAGFVTPAALEHAAIGR